MSEKTSKQTEPEKEEVTPEQLARLEQLLKQIQEVESQLESITEPVPPSSPRGAVPKETVHTSKPTINELKKEYRLPRLELSH